MKYMMDENTPPQIARGFKEFEKEVYNVKNVFGEGLSDVDLAIRLKNDEWIFITRNYKIRKNKHEIKAFKDNKVSIFFMDVTTQLDMWQMIKLLVKNWEEIEKISESANFSFGYRITWRGKPEQLW